VLKKEMESYVRIGGRGLKILHGVRGGVKNCQNYLYVINEWPLTCSLVMTIIWFKIKLHLDCSIIVPLI
jgi:hypothetical protein